MTMYKSRSKFGPCAQQKEFNEILIQQHVDFKGKIGAEGGISYSDMERERQQFRRGR